MLYNYKNVTFEITAKKQSKTCPWGNGGNAYEVTVKNKNSDSKISFDFWDSVSNMDKDCDLKVAFQCFVEDAINGNNMKSSNDVAANFGYEKPSDCFRIFRGLKKSAEKAVEIGIDADMACDIYNDLNSYKD